MSTPYMGLDLPVPTVTSGPDYATKIVTAFESVDAHDHTPGKGTQIPTAGLNINDDLSFNLYNLTAARSLRLNNYSSPLGTASDLCCLYASSGNLYYNNSSGQQIQITAGGALNAASIGGIGGDYATSSASVFYTTASTKYTFWQAANTAAFMDQGATIIRDTGASANGVTVQAPAGLSASYAMTFPTALPGATKIVTLGSTGTLSAVYDVDNVTIEISSSNLRLKDGGITNAKIAANAVTPAKLGSFASTAGTTSGNATTTSTSYVDISGTTISLTASGRPMELWYQPDGSSDSQLSVGGSPGPNFDMYIKLVRTVSGVDTDLAVWKFSTRTLNSASVSGIRFVDIAPPAGTVGYRLRAAVGGAGATCSVLNAKIYAAERA